MNIEELFETTTKSNSVWEQYVPLITNKNHTLVYITDSIEEPSCYNELCYKLKTASEAEIFTLFINTPGGYIDAATMIIDAIKTSKAKVIANISGTVASAGTIITLACDEVIVADHTAFMIHNYSNRGMSGKGHELRAHQEFMDKSLNEAFRVFYKGFLTDKEMQKVLDGQDIWMGKSEVLERLERKYSTNTTTSLYDTGCCGEMATPAKRGRKPKAQ